jgi:phosphoglycerate kinase
LISFKTLDDFDFSGKRVLVRVDINSPIDKKTLLVRDQSKIASAVPTLKELSDKGARIAVVAHQGRKGHYDFIDLSQHAKVLSGLLHREVKYVDDLHGDEARCAIGSLRNGEIVLLKNVRTYDQEDHELSPEHHAKGALVRNLAPLFDVFVNDAFASAHRKHASLIGFTAVLPSAAGRLLEKEIKSLSKIAQSPKRPCVVVFGGTKFADSIPIVRHLLAAGIADKIILGGLVGLAYSVAAGKHVGEENIKVMSHELLENHMKEAQSILAQFAGRIELPSDVALDKDGKRIEATLDHEPPAYPSLDIGSKTIERFGEILSGAKTILISGPVGVFEKEEFAIGTRAIFEKSIASGAFCIIGGGHTAAAANQMSYADKISYTSTGGGALEHFLLGLPMPVIEALNHAAQRQR